MADQSASLGQSENTQQAEDSLEHLPNCPRWGCSLAFLQQFVSAHDDKERVPRPGMRESIRKSFTGGIGDGCDSVLSSKFTESRGMYKPSLRRRESQWFGSSMMGSQTFVTRVGSERSSLSRKSRGSTMTSDYPESINDAIKSASASFRASRAESPGDLGQAPIKTAEICNHYIKPVTKELSMSRRSRGSRMSARNSSIRTSVLENTPALKENEKEHDFGDNEEGNNVSDDGVDGEDGDDDKEDEMMSFAELALKDELIDSRGAPAFAEATHFVSHAWQYNFRSFVAALEDWLRSTDTPEEGTYFWVDAFVVNQHKTQEYPQEWWSSRFMQAVGTIGHTVVVLEPWDDPVPLKRAWVIWELYCTIITGARLYLTMTEKTREKFHRALVDSFEKVQRALSKVDVSKSEAFYIADRDLIHEEIKRTVGFNKLNELIRSRLLQWLTEMARRRLEQLKETESISPDAAAPTDRMKLQDNLARMMRESGNLSAAEDHFRELLADQASALGSDHAATLSCMNQLAVTLQKAGKAEEALKMHRLCLFKRRRLYGLEHADSLQSASNLAVELSLQRPLSAAGVSEAEELFRLAIRGREASAGPDHPGTLYTVSKFASLLTEASRQVSLDHERFREAGELHYRAVSKLTGQVNEGHPLLLAARHNQACHWFAADILRKQGCTIAIQSCEDAKVGTERFLPKSVGGKTVLVHEGGTSYRVDNSELDSGDDGLAFFLSKNGVEPDMSATLCRWGSTIQASEDGDGWVRLQAARRTSSFAGDGNGLELLHSALNQLRTVLELRKMALGTEHIDTRETAAAFRECSSRIRQIRIDDGYTYSTWSELCHEEFQVMGDSAVFREVRRRVRSYGIALVRKELESSGFVDREKGVLTVSTKPFNIFARLAAGVMEQPSMVEEQAYLGEYQKSFQIVCNKPENDEMWDSEDPAWVGRASMSRRHRMLIIKDLHWEWFNCLTFGLVSQLEVGLRKLKECRDAALQWVSAHKDWPPIDRVGLFLHVYAMCSVPSFHLHIIDMDHLGPSYKRMDARNLSLDDAISVLEQELSEEASDPLKSDYEPSSSVESSNCTWAVCRAIRNGRWS